MKKNDEKGFIGLVIVLLFALALAKYVMHWDIIDFLKSEKAAEIFSYIKKSVILVWNKILMAPFIFVWNKIIVGIVWKAILSSYELLKHWVDSQN